MRSLAPPPPGLAARLRRCSSARRCSPDEALPAEAPPASDYAADVGALLRNDLWFMDRRGRDDVRKAASGIAFSHELLVAAFGRGERPALQNEVERLRAELEATRQQAQVSELRLAHSAAQLAELSWRSPAGSVALPPAAALDTVAEQAEASDERDYWYPVAFGSGLGASSLLTFDLFNAPWLLTRDAATGAVSALADSCAHRGCPLSLGKVTASGCVQCPYHGWEYDSTGACTAMPSTSFLPGVGVAALPTIEQDGLLWVWAGEGTPAAALPRTAPPRGFTIMAATALDVPMEAPAAMEALLGAGASVAEADRHHPAQTAVPDATGTAAAASVAAAAAAGDGAGVAVAAALALRAAGAPQPCSVAFAPPGIILQELVLSETAASAAELFGAGDGAGRRVHLAIACVPAKPGGCRILYRLAVNFASPALATAPGARGLWQTLAEDLLKAQLAAEGVGAASNDARAAFQAWRGRLAE